jgi:hypothetical protein
MTISNGTETSGYADSVDIYWNIGWRGVLPLSLGNSSKKGCPPKGFTGHDGVDPSYADVCEWKDNRADFNIALRMPADVIGIDVDCYDGKTGAATLAEAESRWGALPPTYRTTSRDDGSGIRLFRVSPGTALAGKIEFPELGIGHIEIIQRHHRYAVAWPSMHHGTGRRYRWISDLDGSAMDKPPAPSDLPELPAKWAAELSVTHNGTEFASGSAVDVSEALTEGEPTRRVEHFLTTALMVMQGPGARHDAVRDGVLTLLRLGIDGEAGVARALQALRLAFIAAVTGDGSRTRDEAAAEFNRYITNNRVVKLLAEPSTNAFAGYDYSYSYDDDWTAGPGPDRDQHAKLAGSGQNSGPVAGPARSSTASDLAEQLDRISGAKGSGPRSSLYVNIAELLADGLPEPPAPRVLKRRDGHALFYAGEVNCLFGDPESGKTFVALAAVVDALIAGGSALVVDLDHNGVEAIVNRLLMLGAPEAMLSDPRRFLYCAPEDKREVLLAVKDAVALKPTVVVIDSIGELLPVFKANSNSADEFTDVNRKVLQPMANAGSAVVAIDHLAKSADSRDRGQTGTYAKKRAIGGVSLRVKASRQFTPGDGGTAMLFISKDRHGGLRKHCAAGEREPAAGNFVLKSNTEQLDLIGTADLAWHINEPSPSDRDPDDAPEPALIQRISQMDPPPESAEDARRRLKVNKQRAHNAYKAWKATRINDSEQEDE